jgi:hypothetical protein
MPFKGEFVAILTIALATSSAAIGWKSAGGKRTWLPTVEKSAIGFTNSKNYVARTIE